MTIKAIQYRAYGAYAENRFVDLPAPAANDGQVLVRMHTVGINPLDNTIRSGHHYAAGWRSDGSRHSGGDKEPQFQSR